MNDNATPAELLIERAEDYGKTTLELLKLRSISKSADWASTLVMRLVIIAVVALFVLMLSVGLALWFGDLLGKYYYGFFVVAFMYALLGLLLHIFKSQWIKTPISNAIISQLLQ